MFNNTNFVYEFYSLKLFPYKNKNYLLVSSDNFFDFYRHNVYPIYMGTCFSICHWNLNSLTAHNYLKVSLLRTYVAIKKFDVVCLSETYLDSSNLSDDDNFNLPVYNVIRAEHPSNTEKCDVCIYFKNSLPLNVLDIQLLQECINFEIKIADETCNFISLYRSLSRSLYRSLSLCISLYPSQSKDEFEYFADNLELHLDSVALRNPYLIVVLGDFNAQTKGWYSLGKTTYEGTRIDGITSQFGLEQLIHEPTSIIGEVFLHRFNFCFST